LKNSIRLSKEIGNYSIGTDVIIGFPEENEEDLMILIKLVKELHFTYLPYFPFSPRHILKQRK